MHATIQVVTRGVGCQGDARLAAQWRPAAAAVRYGASRAGPCCGARRAGAERDRGTLLWQRLSGRWALTLRSPTASLALRPAPLAPADGGHLQDRAAGTPRPNVVKAGAAGGRAGQRVG